MFHELDAFRDDTPITDDQTVVVMQGVLMSFEYRDRALYCEIVALADIAGGCGTPCYVYSAGAILDEFSRL